MTEIEKANILRLREEGHSIPQIAQELNLPINTVKSFIFRTCKPNPEREETDDPATPPTYPDRVVRRCLFCGQPVTQPPHRKEKKFCCAACRSHWWNQNAAQSQGKSLRLRNCAYCGETFRAYGQRKYCSHGCYISARFGKEACL